MIDTGDVVYHAPSKERWTVACVDGDRLSWCGWPDGEAALDDCTLVKKATQEERLGVLNALASMSSSCHRKNHAQATLDAEREAKEKP